MKNVRGKSLRGLDRETLLVIAQRIIKISRAINYDSLPSGDPNGVGRLQEIIALLDSDADEARWEQLLRRAAGPREHSSPGGSSTLDEKRARADDGWPATAVDVLPANVTASAAVVADHNDRIEQAALMRRKQMVEYLQNAGFDNRLGRVYDTTHPQRRIALKDLPHRKGLPGFEMAVVPDYSPVDGCHGIFINPGEIFSAVLPTPLMDHLWQVRQRKAYFSNEEMVEVVTLMSAGFDV